MTGDQNNAGAHFHLKLKENHENQTGLNLQPPALKLELYPLLHGDNMVIQVKETKHNEQIKKII